MKPYVLSNDAVLLTTILDGNRWHEVKVPFKDIDEAGEYIDDFDKENPTSPENGFGSVPLNLQIQNLGKEAAENVMCECTINGFLVMVHLSSKNIWDDTKVFCDIPEYSVTQVIGEMGPEKIQSLKISVPIKYMCLIAGEILVFKKTELFQELPVKVFFEIVALDIKVKVTSLNSDPIESKTKLYGYGSLEQTLGLTLDDIKERLEDQKFEALKKLLEMHIGVLVFISKTAVFKINQPRFDTTISIDSATSGLNIGAILSKGVKLISLTIVLKEALSGFSLPPIEIFSHSVNGFVMVSFESFNKLLPKGKISVAVTVETQPETETLLATHANQQDDNVAGNLVVTSVIEPEVFRINWKKKNYSASITSNSTLSNFEFFYEPFPGIRFNATGDVNETYLFKVSMPNEIIAGNFTVLCNDEKINNFELMKSVNYSFLQFEYTFASQENRITIIPEFPLFLFLPMTISISLIVAKAKKKHSRSH
jgi:hypothetical protein